jgi:ankyrin repeat protein
MGTRGFRLVLMTAVVGSVGYGLIFAILKVRHAVGSYSLNQRLYTAALHGNTDEVVTLISQGANVNYLGEGYTPLMVAAQSGQAETVAALVARGADINGRDPSGRTALIIAAGKGDRRIVRFLIEHHADVRARDNDGITALAVAKGQQFSRIVALLERAGANH